MSAVDVSKLSDAERIALARELVDTISACLPDRVDAAAFTLKSKIPFKIASLREPLIHRVDALAAPAIGLYESTDLIPAFVLTRAIVETSAVIFTLVQRLERFLADHDVGELDQFIGRSLLGSKNDFTKHEAINVLTNIDRIDNDFDGMRRMYDVLCEFTHPNWSGVLGSFGRVDTSKHVLHLGKGQREPPLAYGLGPFIMGLAIFQNYYNESGSLMLEINDYFESQ